MDDKELEQLEVEAAVCPPGGSYWGVFVGVFAQATLIGAVVFVTSPLWVPAAIYTQIKKKFEPKPVYRGTVRPMVLLNQKEG